MIDSVENLAIVWASIDRLCSDLPGSQWELPTGCPGWTVKDQLSHLVDLRGTRARPARPRARAWSAAPSEERAGPGEQGRCGRRRPRSGAAVLEEFRR